MFCAPSPRSLPLSLASSQPQQESDRAAPLKVKPIVPKICCLTGFDFLDFSLPALCAWLYQLGTPTWPEHVEIRDRIALTFLEAAGGFWAIENQARRVLISKKQTQERIWVIQNPAPLLYSALIHYLHPSSLHLSCIVVFSRDRICFSPHPTLTPFPSWIPNSSGRLGQSESPGHNLPLLYHMLPSKGTNQS